ncbi:hypothetical protein T4E_4352 [Trichinella pseudospiralis]|uniref:Peptidase A2 domain-containing protein n=1 Tax=Trichinella pseudospiralis TaxID=6337 RepID=A0A0V0Y226_TRIPS|nr:hypothetical protein T4E_4352 [Trichinella pseudospiralis]
MRLIFGVASRQEAFKKRPRQPPLSTKVADGCHNKERTALPDHPLLTANNRTVKINMLGHTDVSKPKEWTEPKESRLIFFLGANNVTDPTRRRAAPLRSCGGAVFNLTQALISPSNPNEKFFDEILFILERHSSPQSSQIVAQGCNFSDLEIMLRDRLLIGLRDEELQRYNTSSNIYQIEARTARQAMICQSCGGTHIRSQCRFRNAHCRACQKRTENKSLASVDSLTSKFPDLLQQNNFRSSGKGDESCVLSRKIRVTVGMESFPSEMEIDTGSEFTILSEYFSETETDHSETLATFQGELVKEKESCSVKVQYGNIHRTLTLFVTTGCCPNLLRLNWFQPLEIQLSGAHQFTPTPLQISEVLRKCRSVFTEELGMYVEEPVSLDLDPNVTMICMKRRKVPFALREKINAELDKLVEEYVLEQVDHQVWSISPITPVKPDGTIRICNRPSSAVSSTKCIKTNDPRSYDSTVASQLHSSAIQQLTAAHGTRIDGIGSYNLTFDMSLRLLVRWRFRDLVLPKNHEPKSASHI